MCVLSILIEKNNIAAKNVQSGELPSPEKQKYFVVPLSLPMPLSAN